MCEVPGVAAGVGVFAAKCRGNSAATWSPVTAATPNLSVRHTYICIFYTRTLHTKNWPRLSLRATPPRPIDPYDTH